MEYDDIRKIALNLQLILGKTATIPDVEQTHIQNSIWEIFAILEQEWAFQFNQEDKLEVIVHNESIMLAQKELLDLYFELRKKDKEKT